MKDRSPRITGPDAARGIAVNKQTTTSLRISMSCHASIVQAINPAVLLAFLITVNLGNQLLYQLNHLLQLQSCSFKVAVFSYDATVSHKNINSCCSH